MWVIGPMFLYLCERILRFIRYMQAVRYRKVGVGCHALSCMLSWFTLLIDVYIIAIIHQSFSLFSFKMFPSDCDQTVQGAWAAAGEERFQDGGGPICLPQLPGHLPPRVASVHHDLCPGRGLLQRPHPLRRWLDPEAHQYSGGAARGGTGTQVSSAQALNSDDVSSHFRSLTHRQKHTRFTNPNVCVLPVRKYPHSWKVSAKWLNNNHCFQNVSR